LPPTRKNRYAYRALSLRMLKENSVRNMRFAFLLPLLLLVTPAAAATLTPPTAGYSATRIVNAGGMEMSGKVHSEDGKEHWETNMQGIRSISILLMNEGRMFVYMPDMNMAMEMSLDEAAASQPGLEALRDGAEATEEGKEIVEGEQTTRYLVAEEPGSGVRDVRVWVTSDGIPLKMEGKSDEGDFMMLLKDLQRGKQDASLFRLPSGVTPMKMPAGMPGMMGGAGGMPGMASPF
jgi:outer membrane lipoprotein-sorting protein